jgi:hypothetical protein
MSTARVILLLQLILKYVHSFPWYTHKCTKFDLIGHVLREQRRVLFARIFGLASRLDSN